MGPRAAAVRGLLLAMEDSDAEVAETASKALNAAMGSLNREHVTALSGSLGSQKPAARLFAVLALGKIGREAKAAVDPLCVALNEVRNRELAVAILESLSSIEPPPGEVAKSIAKLIEATETGNRPLSIRAAITLAKFDLKMTQEETKVVAVRTLARS